MSLLKTGVVGVVPKVSGAVVCAADGKADSNRLRAVATSPENQRCGLAAARKECRGAHTVSDYERPADDAVAPLGRDDANWMKHTLWHSASNSLTYKPVKLKPLTVDSVPPKVRTF